jgi:hypothetical protein
MDGAASGPEGRSMRATSGIILIMAIVIGHLAPAHSAVDFLADGQFRYGMLITEANEWLANNESDFLIQYRIDTPSTNEIACVYQESEFYRVRFYQGSCYFIERRSEIEAEAIPGVFEQFTAEYGESPEVTQSRDQRLWYGHWMLRDRDVELTAYDRAEGRFILTYQEFDPLLLGEALRVQEQEVVNSGVRIDPITGKPVLVETAASPETSPEDSGNAEEAAGDEAGGDEAGGDEATGEEAGGDDQEAESESGSDEDADQDEDEDAGDDEDDEDWDWYYG